MTTGERFTGVARSAVGYSETPIKTGETWIDGRPIWRVVVDMGDMPNGDNKGVVFDDGSNGVVNLVVSVNAIAFENSTTDKWRPLGQDENAVTSGGRDSGFEVQISTVGSAAVVIENEAFWSGFNQVWAIVEYVKSPG